MNVIDTLKRELEGKNWNPEQKARYLYLRSCQLFSYDPRYHAAELLTNSYSIQQEIKNRVINLEDVEETTAVCYTHSGQIFSKLMRQFLGIICGTGSATTFNVGTQRIITHAPIDFVRAKMGCSTPGYCPIFRDEQFKSEIKKIDQEIAYINEDYYEVELKKIKEDIELALLEESREYRKDAQFLSKIKRIKSILEDFQLQDSYTDSAAGITLLKENILSASEQASFRSVPLFQPYEDKEWEFIKVYRIDLKEDVIYYILERQKNGYTFHETLLDDINPRIEAMEGRHKELLYERR